MRLIPLVGVTGAALAATMAQGATVDLQPYVDANVSTYTSGADYPSVSTTIGGIDFSLASFDGGTGVVQLTGAESHTVSVGQSAVDTAYVIINSAYGVLGANNGTLTFDNGMGASISVDLFQGMNIRDHWTAYNNVATDIFATATYDGGNRFDVYRYDLTALGGTLASVTFASTSASNPEGAPFLAALTTALETPPVPEPGTWLLMLCGVGMVGLARRHQDASGPPRRPR